MIKAYLVQYNEQGSELVRLELGEYPTQEAAIAGTAQVEVPAHHLLKYYGEPAEADPKLLKLPALPGLPGLPPPGGK